MFPTKSQRHYSSLKTQSYYLISIFKVISTSKIGILLESPLKRELFPIAPVHHDGGMQLDLFFYVLHLIKRYHLLHFYLTHHENLLVSFLLLAGLSE